MLALALAILLGRASSQPDTAPSPSATISAPLQALSPVPDAGSVARPMPGGAVMPIPPDAAVIRNSGSTNTAGYIIAISPDGRTLIRQNGETTNATLARPQTNWLLAKLRGFAPLDALPLGHCMRSASFGSSTTISYGGVTTPDLGCAVSDQERELARTVGVIVAQLHISTFPRHRAHLL